MYNVFVIDKANYSAKIYGKDLSIGDASRLINLLARTNTCAYMEETEETKSRPNYVRTIRLDCADLT